MKQNVAVFRLPHQIYYADTCEPLKQASERGEVKVCARGRGAYPGEPLPDDIVPEVRSLGYWDADQPQSWGLDWHRNEGIEFTYLARGKLPISVEDQRFQLKRGNLTITRPWQLHRVGNPQITPSRLYWLILDVGVRRPNQPWHWPSWIVSSRTEIETLTEFLRHNEQPVWSADDEIERCFTQMIEAAQNMHESRLKLAISSLLVAVTDLLQRHRPHLDTSLSSAQRTVELFLTRLPEMVDRDWTLDEMAAACGLARSRFTHYCNELTNMSPIEYLLFCRIQIASSLLQQGELSITDIAFRCGFESSQYFTRVFRKQMGCPPRDYRRNCTQ